jgi:hypothetical protein
VHQVCSTSDFEIGGGTRKSSRSSVVTAQRFVCGLGLVKIHSGEKWSDESAVGEAGSTPVGLEC